MLELYLEEACQMGTPRIVPLNEAADKLLCDELRKEINGKK